MKREKHHDKAKNSPANYSAPPPLPIVFLFDRPLGDLQGDKEIVWLFIDK